MNPWIPAAITIVVNIIAVAFAFGKLSQSVTDLKRGLGVTDATAIRKNGKDDRWKERMEDTKSIHAMLPECIDAFKDFRQDMKNLTDKVDTLLLR